MKRNKTYKVFVKNLVLKALVGIYPDEKIKKQKVRFNVAVIAKDNITNNNHISNFVSYVDIISIIKKTLSHGHIPLIENLGEKIAVQCMENKKVISVEIKIEKLDLFKDAESVGIKIIRKQS